MKKYKNLTEEDIEILKEWEVPEENIEQMDEFYGKTYYYYVEPVRSNIGDIKYDYDKYLESGQFVWQNSYFDNNIGREVYFGDIEDKSKPKYRWYVFYDFKNGYSFHSPIEERDISTKFKDLDIVEIDTLDTHGKDISELASTNFVNKIVDLIRNGNYQYVD